MNLNLTISRFNTTGISFDLREELMNGSEKFNKTFVKLSVATIHLVALPVLFINQN
jgi:hypothetical protein